MSKQSKGLAGFGAVANDPKMDKRNDADFPAGQDSDILAAKNKKIDWHQENHSPVTNSLTDIIDSVTNKPKQIKKRQISTYIDEDVAKKLDKFGKEHGKGAKSELINNFLKNALK